MGVHRALVDSRAGACSRARPPPSSPRACGPQAEVALAALERGLGGYAVRR